MMRTVILGEPGDTAKRVMEANRRTLELLYSNVKSGRTAHEVAVEVKKGVEDVDKMIFRSGHFGYSIGLGFPPTWTDGPMYIAEGNERVLEAGMTFHTPHSFRIPAQFVIGHEREHRGHRDRLRDPDSRRRPSTRRQAGLIASGCDFSGEGATLSRWRARCPHRHGTLQRAVPCGRRDRAGGRRPDQPQLPRHDRLGAFRAPHTGSGDRRLHRPRPGSAQRTGCRPAGDCPRGDPCRSADRGRPLAPHRGRPRARRAGFRDPALLESAVGLLARLHRSDADFRGEMALFPILDRYFRLCGRRRPELLAPLEGPRRRAEELRPWIEGTREPDCPCHIDPAPSNFVLVAGASPPLYLLDWEFSARCEPVWDLAYLSADAAFPKRRTSTCCPATTGAGPDPSASTASSSTRGWRTC